MKVKELRELLVKKASLTSRDDDEEVTVLLDLPSIGPRACTKVTYASFGIDWNRGLQFKTETNIVPKDDKQSVFEAAFELLAYLATKPSKRQGYEQRTAVKILEKYGCTKKDFDTYKKVYHKE